MKIKAFLALLMSFCILLPAFAQTQQPAAPPPPQQIPTDDKDDVVKITTNLVQVDAVVTKDGKPVTNLTADDFEIYEDGKKQTITSFAYISNVPGAIAQPLIPSREKGVIIPPTAPVNRDQPHRTIAFVVDDLGLSAESMNHVRKQLRKFVTEQLQPNDVVAIIRTGGEMGVLQQFTNDKRILTRAVDRLRWNLCNRVGVNVFTAVGSGSGISICGRRSLGSTLQSLRFIIDAMGYLPGRKSLVLMSDSLPREDQDEFFGRSFIDEGGLSGEGEPGAGRGLSPMDAGTGRGGPSSSPLDSVNYSNALQKVAEKAIRASVVIYSVDTQGLQYTGPTAADQFRGDARQMTAQINQVLSSRSRLLWARQGGGELIARQTGGFQIRNSNSFKLDKIVEDQSGYYLLGYRPTEETFNRRFHHIKAKVKRSGMSLRTRFGFFGVTEEEASKGKLSARDITNLALASPFAAQEISVDINPFYINDKTTGSVVRSFVYLAAKDMTFTLVDGRHQASFELHGVIFGDNGSIVSQLTRGATLNLPQSDYEYALQNGMGLTFDMPVKRAGAFQVRIAARDRVSSKVGSAGEFVAVPDLKNKKLAVSGIVLATGSDSTGQSLANAGARRFTPNSDVHFAYMIYNAINESGALRNLVMQVKLFRDGKDVFTSSEAPIKGTANQTDPSRIFAGGSVRLPPDLEPGSYYLQITLTEIGVKNKVEPLVQWIDFEIEK